jgi:thiazole synthase
MSQLDQPFIIDGVTLKSRLIVGTGKYKSFEENKQSVIASGADCVTVAVRRVNILDRNSENLLDYIDPSVYKILPNTAGCYTAEEAIRTARLAHAAGITNWVKLEVIGDPKTLLPDNEATLAATRVLVKEGFVVFPYISDDPIMAKKIEDAGAAVVMPLASPIGSGLGIQNRYSIQLILEAVSIPVIVDAGVGTASDATVAMELGCHGILMNTAIAGARYPIQMAEAMNYAVKAGRMAYLAGRMPKKRYAQASSPTEGMIE